MDRSDRTSGTGFGTVRRAHAAGAAMARPGGRARRRAQSTKHALDRYGVARSPRRGDGPRGDQLAPGRNEGPVPFDSTVLPRLDEAPEAIAEAAPDPRLLWAGRLVFDAAVSVHSPVVRGTRVTVRLVVSMVVDGRSWAEILRAHPELTEADVRACLAYCVEEEGAGALWAPVAMGV